MSHELTVKEHYGVPHGAADDEAYNYFGPTAPNYHLWLRKIKKTFDPKGVSEASGYLTTKE